MSVLAMPRLSGACVLMLSVLLAAPMSVQAQSRRDRAQVEALKRDLADADARYRAAANDPQASAAVLGKMEAVITACAKQRGCDVATFLPVYRGMLQSTVKGPQEFDVGGGGLIDFTADGVPPEAGADALLDKRNRRFVQAVRFNPAMQGGIRRWLQCSSSGGLPEALLFGILAKESNGKVHVGSRAGRNPRLRADGDRRGLAVLHPQKYGIRFPRVTSRPAVLRLKRPGTINDLTICLDNAAYTNGFFRAWTPTACCRPVVRSERNL